jgi:hypothetical protein
MKPLSMKEFVSRLNSRLNELSPEQLKKILLEQASKVPPADRQRFLDSLILTGSLKSERPIQDDAARLLEEIDALVEEASLGKEEAWGWDDGYDDDYYDRDYGDQTHWRDDSWKLQLDVLFERVSESFERGDYALAREAYQKLLAVSLGTNEEEGEFPGDDLRDRIKTNLDEAALRYLRCVYLTEKAASRPAALWQGFSEFYDFAQDLSIEGVINVAVEELPELQAFSEKWIPYLKKQGRNGQRMAVELLKEAVRLFQGIEGLQELATHCGRQFPGAFVEWLKALKAEGNPAEVIRVALTALETLPESLSIRATIADYLHEAATALGMKDLAEKSRKDAVYASPSLKRLLNLLDETNDSLRSTVIADAVAHFEAHQKRQEKSQPWDSDYNRSGDLSQGYVHWDLPIFCRLLKGDFLPVAKMMTRSKPLGWSFGQNSNFLAVPFFLRAQWDVGVQLTPNMTELWLNATEIPDQDDFRAMSPESLGPRLRTHLERALSENGMSEEERNAYFKDARRAATKRIEAIVSEKHRKSYPKAAQLALAVAETCWHRAEKEQAREYIEKFRKRFNRHHAFQEELRRVIRKSGISEFGKATSQV